MSRQTGWLIVVAACAASLAGADESRSLRDDGIYQDGGYWATPDQTHRIVRYCLDHEDEFVFRGQVRHLPKGTFWGKPDRQWIDR